MLKELRNRIRGYVPFTNWWLVERHLDKSATDILDLGCGKGKPMCFLNRHKDFFTVGIDGFERYVEECEHRRTHDVVLCGDIRNLPYKDGAFDIVMCLQALEHLDKEDGIALLKDMGRLARKQVILTTDLGRADQGVADGNELQGHRHIWSVKELKDTGFRVYGMGVREFIDNWLVNTFLKVCFGWVTYYMPRWAGSVLCVKELG